MARSLEGKVFVWDSNNGVTALVERDLLERMRESHDKREEIIRQLLLKRSDDLRRQVPESEREEVRKVVDAGLAGFPTPMFTFAREDRAKDEPWFTGSSALFAKLQRYIAQQGGAVITGSFYVPFSNHTESGLHGREAQVDELRYVHIREDFARTFGISPEELMSEAAVAAA